MQTPAPSEQAVATVSHSASRTNSSRAGRRQGEGEGLPHNANRACQCHDGSAGRRHGAPLCKSYNSSGAGRRPGEGEGLPRNAHGACQCHSEALAVATVSHTARRTNSSGEAVAKVGAKACHTMPTEHASATRKNSLPGCQGRPTPPRCATAASLEQANSSALGAGRRHGESLCRLCKPQRFQSWQAPTPSELAVATVRAKPHRTCVTAHATERGPCRRPAFVQFQRS